jgi:hypothetical protein
MSLVDSYTFQEEMGVGPVRFSVDRKGEVRSEFVPRRRLVRVERGGEFSLPVGGAPCKDHLFLVVGATIQSKHAPKMASMFNL